MSRLTNRQLVERIYELTAELLVDHAQGRSDLPETQSRQQQVLDCAAELRGRIERREDIQ